MPENTTVIFSLIAIIVSLLGMIAAVGTFSALLVRKGIKVYEKGAKAKATTQEAFNTSFTKQITDHTTTIEKVVDAIKEKLTDHDGEFVKVNKRLNAQDKDIQTVKGEVKKIQQASKNPSNE